VTPTRRLSLVRLVAGGLHHSGLLSPLARAVGYARRAPAFPILTFHRVNDDGDPFFPAVPTAVFEDHVAHLARHYDVLTIEEAAERLQARRAPRNGLAITFDDGYRDNLTQAAPILARHGIPATIFLATGHIGTGIPMWFDQVAQALKTTEADAVVLGAGRPLELSSRSSRLVALQAALAHLKSLPDLERRRALDRLVATLSPRPFPDAEPVMLDWPGVAEIRRLGFSVGAHTISHPILSRVTAEQAWTEISGSKSTIERMLGEPVRAFAYPNGGAEDYTPAVVAQVRDAGFLCALTTRHGVNTAATPRFELRRGSPGIGRGHVPTFAVKLAYYRLAQS